MVVFTLGFTKKSASHFFGLIRKNLIELLIDVRLNNKSQLAGFTKGDDLAYFLQEICQCKYVHVPEAAPTKDLLKDYKNGTIQWKEYERIFSRLLVARNLAKTLDARFGTFSRVCLLCSEETPEQCHRRLVAEDWKKLNTGIEIVHL